MANSKAYLSFALLFVFLLSAQVLAHELRDTSPEEQHSYNGERNNYKHPTLSQDLEKDRRSGSSMQGFRHRMGPGYRTPKLEDRRVSEQIMQRLVSELEDLKSDLTFPRTARKTMTGTGRGHFGHNPSNLEDINEKYEDGNVVRHRNHMRPSEADSRTFPAFPTKATMMRHGGVPRNTQDIGEETMN